MKNKHLWIPAFIFIGACVVSLIYSIIDFTAINPGLAYSSEIVQFNYDGASDGKDPNGNRFNPTGFLTDDIIEAALEKSQLNYEVEDVRPFVTIENIVPNNIVEEINSYEKIVDTDNDGRDITTDKYYPVRYRFMVHHNLNKKLSKKVLNSFVSSIVDEYCDKFYQTYKKSFAKEDYGQLIDVSGYDYIFQTQIYTSKFKILMEYANSIYEEHNDFVIDGKSFNDLYLRVRQLINADIDRVNQLITFNALSNDVERLKSYYNYIRTNLVNDKQKYEADQITISNQITAYSTTIPDTRVTTATGGTVVTVDSNTSTTYSTLVSRQIDIENKITSLTKSIQECDDTLTKLNSASSTEEVKAIVDGLIEDLGQDYKDVETLFNTMLDAYNDKYVKEGVIDKNQVSYYSNSIISKNFVIRTIKNSAPIILTVVVGIAFYFLGREVKKEKRKAQ